MKKHVQLLVIGGGPAGLAAAVEAYDKGVREILIVERGDMLGGILNQCIHTGFGLHIFKEELTGPEYALKFCDMVRERDIPYLLNCMVLSLDDHAVTVVGRECGMLCISCDALILAMGCRERPRGAIGILGDRPAGVFTAGTAQRFINLEGYMVGREVVILGSGDIGLIMARRMTLEGAKVKMVCEIEPYSNGLARNIEQCLRDFEIPLLLSHTITAIHGKERITGVTIAKVDEAKRVIPGTQEDVKCDTLLLSVGLIPENELSRNAQIELDPKTNGPVINEGMQTSKEWIFACGNVVHVHDLVDFVTQESRRAGQAAAQYILEHAYRREDETCMVGVKNGRGVRYVVPQKMWVDAPVTAATLFFRSDRVYGDTTIRVRMGSEVLASVRRKRIMPSQMETVVLPREKMQDMKKLGGAVLEVEIAAAEERK